MENIAKNIKVARESLHLTQAQFAKLTGLTPAAISQLETGKRMPSYKSLILLATSLGVSSDFLLGINENMRNDEAARVTLNMFDDNLKAIRRIVYAMHGKLHEIDND